MHYMALNIVTDNLERVKIRADAGGHSAAESRLQESTTAAHPSFPSKSGRLAPATVPDRPFTPAKCGGAQPVTFQRRKGNSSHERVANAPIIWHFQPCARS